MTFSPIVINPSVVILHLSSDGRLNPTSPNDTIAVKLLFNSDDDESATKNRYMNIAEKAELSCDVNQMHIEIPETRKRKTKHLSSTITTSTSLFSELRVKAVRIEFKTSNLAISAVGLRYPSGVATKKCNRDQYYDKTIKNCLPRKMKHPSKNCPELNLPNSDTATCSEDGQSCQIKCIVGYERRSKKKAVVCNEGNWINTEPCLPIDCGTPKVQYAITSKYMPIRIENKKERVHNSVAFYVFYISITNFCAKFNSMFNFFNYI